MTSLSEPGLVVRRGLWKWLFPAVLLLPAVAAAAPTGEGESASLLIALALILVGAKLGGEIAVRLGQPSVLGEIAMGVLIGVVERSGAPIPAVSESAGVDLLAHLGVIVLMFEVGLGSTVSQMLAVGFRATLVAVVGVVAPIGIWFLVAHAVSPDASWAKSLFIGAALCATSVGITARVFQDLGAAQTMEARVVMGAAVVDDVLGLIVLTLLTGLLSAASTGSAMSFAVPLKVVMLSAGFLSAAILLGPPVARWIFKASHRLRSSEILLPLSLSFAFLLGALASAVQLAPIVGAYAAGLVLDEAHYKTLLDRGEKRLEDLIRPVGQLLIPMFFVVMGARVDLRAFAQGGLWLMTVVLILVALLSKLVCGLCVAKGYNRLAVGFGMVPRGEVGLIFADAGRRMIFHGESLLSAGEFASIVMVVLFTTVVTPGLLGWAIKRRPMMTDGTSAVAA